VGILWWVNFYVKPRFTYGEPSPRRFRFDDTKTIVTQCQGVGVLGDDSFRLFALQPGGRSGLAYCVAKTQPMGGHLRSEWGVMDGQWDIDEAYRFRDASYDSLHPGWDDSAPENRDG